jgi:hypothetical protein
LLHATEKIFAAASSQLSGNVTGEMENITILSQAYGVAQHHDAVAGTTTYKSYHFR